MIHHSVAVALMAVAEVVIGKNHLEKSKSLVMKKYNLNFEDGSVHNDISLKEMILLLTQPSNIDKRSHINSNQEYVTNNNNTCNNSDISTVVDSL
jgi:hypothetical protein